MRHEADQAMGLISEVKGIKPVYTVYCMTVYRILYPSVSYTILYHPTLLQKNLVKEN